jgi:hypothetical protein
MRVTRIRLVESVMKPDRQVGLAVLLCVAREETATSPIRCSVTSRLSGAFRRIIRCAIRAFVDEVLSNMTREFDRCHDGTTVDAAGAAVARAIAADLFVRSAAKLLLLEELDYNLLFRWFVGLTMDDPILDATTFTKNHDRLLNQDVARSQIDTRAGVAILESLVV